MTFNFHKDEVLDGFSPIHRQEDSTHHFQGYMQGYPLAADAAVPAPGSSLALVDADRYDREAAIHESRVAQLAGAPHTATNLEAQIQELLEGQESLRHELQEVKLQVRSTHSDMESFKAMGPPRGSPGQGIYLPPSTGYQEDQLFNTHQQSMANQQQSIPSLGSGIGATYSGIAGPAPGTGSAAAREFLPLDGMPPAQLPSQMSPQFQDVLPTQFQERSVGSVGSGAPVGPGSIAGSRRTRISLQDPHRPTPISSRSREVAVAPPEDDDELPTPPRNLGYGAERVTNMLSSLVPMSSARGAWASLPARLSGSLNAAMSSVQGQGQGGQQAPVSMPATTSRGPGGDAAGPGDAAPGGGVQLPGFGFGSLLGGGR
jgi:hypothetical protein